MEEATVRKGEKMTLIFFEDPFIVSLSHQFVKPILFILSHEFEACFEPFRPQCQAGEWELTQNAVCSPDPIIIDRRVSPRFLFQCS